MKSWKPRSGTAQQLLNTAATAQPTDIPQPIKDWLARLFLLYGLPFDYLVPDYRMLPAESIRWSFMDINWLERAMDGALSIGRTGSLHFVTDLAQQSGLTEEILQQTQQVRSRLRQVPQQVEPSEGGRKTVMLVRSAVVGGYPGMEVIGLDADKNKVELLRMDPLAKDVLLIIFEDLPAEVKFIEPSEGLHFGVRTGAVSGCEGGSPAEGAFTLLRSLQAGKIGEQITQEGEAVKSQVFFRDNDQALGVIDVQRSAGELKCWLQKKDDWPSGQDLSAADFSVEMIRAAGLQVFVPETNGSSDGGTSS
jgi:hypothetical protein